MKRNGSINTVWCIVRICMPMHAKSKLHTSDTSFM